MHLLTSKPLALGLLLLLAASVALPAAAVTITDVGLPGADGADGGPNASGTPGTAGGGANAASTDPANVTNTAEATGGA